MVTATDSRYCMKSVNNSEFQLIRQLIYQQTGIFLNDHKKTMVGNRLRRRLDLLGFENYKRYYDYMTKEPAGRQELTECINCLTTNETFFFRHYEQIEYLVENILPELKSHQKPEQKTRIWSIGCSTGEEPYSIAISLDKKLKNEELDHIEIFASDINQSVIERAKKGIYNTYAVQQMPEHDRHRYFHYDAQTSQYDITRRIKDRVRFCRHNILEPFRCGLFDVIICRNVLIYFNKESKEKALERIVQHLKPDGFLIIGFAESLIEHKSLFTYIRPTIYRRTGK